MTSLESRVYEGKHGINKVISICYLNDIRSIYAIPVHWLIAGRRVLAICGRRPLSKLLSLDYVVGKL
jgi:hypothetical protein